MLIDGISLTSLTLSFSLPLNRNIKVHSPFSIDSQTEKRHYTYLDTIGRPALILEKTNVVDEFNGPIYVRSFPVLIFIFGK